MSSEGTYRLRNMAPSDLLTWKSIIRRSCRAAKEEVAVLDAFRYMQVVSKRRRSEGRGEYYGMTRASWVGTRYQEPNMNPGEFDRFK